MNYEAARKTMLESQIQPNGVTDKAILNAFSIVPRELFVPKSRRALSYSESHIETLEDRFLWRATEQARFLQAMMLVPSDLVLVIGGGEGYVAALLNTIVETVIALEEEEEFSKKASDRLLQLGFDRVACVTGSLTAGFTNEGPYDAVILNGRVDYIPDVLFEQVREGGCLGAVIGSDIHAQAKVFEKRAGRVSEKTIFECLPPELKAFRKERTFQF